MARDTSLTYSLYGKDVSASKAMKDVGAQVKKVGIAFAAAGALASKFAYDAVKAAAEDEQSQVKLAKALSNTAGATKAQVASTEKLITKLQMTYGVADDKLRPAFATLTRSTHSITESSKLMNTALDISAATGKDLGSVSLSLAKAHNGQFGALTRLGIPLDKSILKSKDFNKVMEVLTKTFGGSAKAATQTLTGKFNVLQQNLQETKESIGTALMPMVKKLADYVLNTVVPNLQSFVGVFTGDKGINSAMHDGTIKAHEWGLKVKKALSWVWEHKNDFKLVGEYMAAFWVTQKIAGAVSVITKAFKAIRAVAAGAAVAEAFATGGASIGPGLLAASAVAAAFGVAALNVNWSNKGSKKDLTQQQQGTVSGIEQSNKTGKPYTNPYTGMTWDPKTKTWSYVPQTNGQYQPRAVGGSVVRGLRYTVGERGPETFTPTTTGRITPHGLGSTSGVGVVVNVHGSVIHERDLAISVRDQIAQLMRRRGLDPAILGV